MAQSVRSSYLLGTSPGFIKSTSSVAPNSEVYLSKQPQISLPINWANPITANMLGVYDGRHLALKSIVGDLTATPPDNAVEIIRGNVLAIRRSNQFSMNQPGKSHSLLNGYAGPSTIMSHFINLTTNTSTQNICQIGSFFGHKLQVINGVITAQFRGGTASSGDSTIPTDQVASAFARHTPNNEQAFWVNGVKQSVVKNEAILAFGDGAFISVGDTGLGFLISAAWMRALTDAEIASLTKNPWQLFRPVQRKIWTPA